MAVQDRIQIIDSSEKLGLGRCLYVPSLWKSIPCKVLKSNFLYEPCYQFEIQYFVFHFLFLFFFLSKLSMLRKVICILNLNRERFTPSIFSWKWQLKPLSGHILHSIPDSSKRRYKNLISHLFFPHRTVPVYFIWLKYISWFMYGFEALIINQWKGYGSIRK